MATNPASVRDTDVKLTMAPDGVRSGAGGAGAGARDGEAKVDGKAKPEAKAEDVPFKTLLRYAETTDYVLYFVGTIAGIANGLTMPLFSLVFGELLNSFNPADDGADIMEGVSKWAMWISLAGVGAWLMSYLEVACFSVAVRCERRCTCRVCNGVGRCAYAHVRNGGDPRLPRWPDPRRRSAKHAPSATSTLRRCSTKTSAGSTARRRKRWSPRWPSESRCARKPGSAGDAWSCAWSSHADCARSETRTIKDGIGDKVGLGIRFVCVVPHTCAAAAPARRARELRSPAAALAAGRFAQGHILRRLHHGLHRGLAADPPAHAHGAAHGHRRRVHDEAHG